MLVHYHYLYSSQNVPAYLLILIGIYDCNFNEEEMEEFDLIVLQL